MIIVYDGRRMNYEPPILHSFLGGTATSWRVQSAWFTGRRVSCIMHGGCYFHHMGLSGVIVVPAPSAQIALCSQIAVLVSTSALSPSYLLHFFPLPSLLYFTLLWKWSQRAQWTPLTGPGSRVVVDPGFRGALSWAGYCDKASPRCQATQENEREKVALLLSPCIISHSKWQPSTQAQMPTDAVVSARGVRVDVWMFACMCTQPPECECLCACASGFTLLWNLAAYRTLCSQIT